VLDGLAMCFVGVLLGQVGTDRETAIPRFTMDIDSLRDGIHLVSIALGCFGIAEITKNLDNNEQ
jgi:TctA family transporter